MASTVASAKEQVVRLIQEDIEKQNLPVDLESNSPDGDLGKFVLDGKLARAVHRRDGFHVKINRAWFGGQVQKPNINRTDFYWYVFALVSRGSREATTYYICTYKQLMDFVLDFKAPKGKDYRDRTTWNGRIYILDEDQRNGYFCWQDEVGEDRNKPGRYIKLRNVREILGMVESLYVEDEAARDLRKYSHTYDDVSETEREAIIKSRRGQGKFRDDLLEYWGECAVTGVSNPELLIASHIKPWNKSTNLERLDVFNGILLNPTLDKLFDKGFITFDNEGRIMISPELDAIEFERLPISRAMSLCKLENQHQIFLEYHRQRIFRS